MDSSSENVKITGGENCGNSPKMLLLRDFTIACARKDIGFCMEWLTDDIVWEMIGDKRREGHADVKEALNRISDYDIQELQLENILTHGKAGAVNGAVVLKDQRVFSFCTVYNFKGHSKDAKLEKMTSYIIQTS